MSLRYRNVPIIGTKLPIITGAVPPVTGTGTLECRLSPTGTGTGTGDFGKVPVIGTGDKFVEVPVPVTNISGFGKVRVIGTGDKFVKVPVPVTGTGDFEMVPVTGTGGHIPAPAPAAIF